MSEEEVIQKTKEILSTHTYPNFGAAMGAVMKEFKGQADGQVVAKTVKELYTQTT
jgi:Glu-tRNA(Gln) amidotransferase subunit E-like FAD-binding protein